MWIDSRQRVSHCATGQMPSSRPACLVGGRPTTVPGRHETGGGSDRVGFRNAETFLSTGKRGEVAIGRLALCAALLALVACSSDTPSPAASATPTPLPPAEEAPPPDTAGNCSPGAPGLPTVSGRVLSVSPDGSDADGDGSPARPFASIAAAGAIAAPGDTIALMAGTYGRQLVTDLQGSASAPVVIRPATGAHVVIDGSHTSNSVYEAALDLQSNTRHLVVDGLEIVNLSGRGVHLGDAESVTVQNCVVHDTRDAGFSISGRHLLIDHNEVYRIALVNENGLGGGWPGAVMTDWWRTSSSDVVFRRNHIHECWGECLIALFLDGGQIVENEIHDCYSVAVYLDNARNMRVERNVIYRTSSRFDHAGKGAANGILLGHEHYPVEDRGSFPYPTENILVANNLIAHTKSVGSWLEDRDVTPLDTYRNVTFAHNVIYQPVSDALIFGDSASYPASNLAFINNVVIDGGGVWLATPGACVFSHNCWQNTPGAPPAEGDQNGCALLAPSVPPVPEDFRPIAGSPLLGAGIPVAGVGRDFFCAARSATAPSIGLAEDAAD